MITAEQRAERRNFIGSSDSPAIVGVDPWRSQHDVYAEKVLDLDEIEDSEPIDRGNSFEREMCEWAGRELGVEIMPDVRRVSPSNPLFAANHDALIPLRVTEGIEAKTTNMGEEFGDPGTDQVPERVIVQAHHQMFVSDLDTVWVPVLLARFGRIHRELYCVKRNEDLINAIVSTGEEFWGQHVAPRIPPTAWTPSLEVLKRVKRVPEKVMEADHDTRALLRVYLSSQSILKKYEAAHDEAKARLLAALGDAEALDYGDEKQWFRYMAEANNRIDTKGLRLAHPDIVETFTKQGTKRVPRICNKPKEH